MTKINKNIIRHRMKAPFGRKKSVPEINLDKVGTDLDDDWDKLLADAEEVEIPVVNVTRKVKAKGRSSVKKPPTSIERIVATLPAKAIPASQPASPSPKAKVRKVVNVTRVDAVGPASSPEPGDKSIRSLWECATAEDVWEWQAETHAKLSRKALAAIKDRILSDVTRAGINALVSEQATDVPIMANERVCSLAAQDLHRKLSAIADANPGIEFALVTIIDGGRQTSSDKPIIDLGEPRSKVLSVSRKMSKNFLGSTELAFFNSHTHPHGGRTIHPHEHFLIWGQNVFAKAKTVAAKRMADFGENFTGAPQIDVRRVSSDSQNLARMAAYLFKAPAKGMTWRPAKGERKGYLHGSEKSERNITFLRMAQLRSMLSIEDVVLAGGQGKAIRSDMIKLLRASCKSEVPVQSRVMRVDEIPAFWVEAARELGKSTWRLLVIISKK